MTTAQKTYTAAELQQILTDHKLWLDTYWAEASKKKGARAVLTGADLRGADLKGAVLTGAVLTRADLRGAVLTGAVLRGADLTGAVLTNDIRWEQYKSEVVPALCVAGGKTLDEVANPTSWGCNSWSNCPMHAAFDADGLSQVPPLYRGLANEFIQFFDAGLLPLGEINPKYADAEPASCEVKS